MKKILGKISSQLMTQDQTVDLKLKEQHYVMILPKHLIQHLGIISDKIDFEVIIDNSNKLTLVGPKISSQPKSDTTTYERGGFVIWPIKND